jgi:hypothetical protein
MLVSEHLTNVESRITNRSITLEIPSEFEWITRTVSFLQDQASELSWGDSINSSRIKVSLHEALTNAIVHGNLVVGQLGVEEFWFVCHDSLKISGCHHLF